ncbi:hypothetical protein D3C76_1554520 [compost metagenome]
MALPSTWVFWVAMLVLALLRLSMDSAEPAPVCRFLWSAWNSALVSLSAGLPVSTAYTRSPMVPLAAIPILRGMSVSMFISSLMMAWRVMLNSSP